MHDTEVVKVDEAERTSAVAAIQAGQEFTTFKDAMWAWECAIRKGDEYALRARWESGKLMLASRRGKRLDNGVLATYAKALQTSTSELSSRQKFAEKFPERCPTQAELHTAMGSRRLARNGDPLPAKPSVVTWNAIRTQLLANNPRGKKEPNVGDLLKDAYKNIERVCCLGKTAEDWNVIGKVNQLVENMTIDRDGIEAASRYLNVAASALQTVAYLDKTAEDWKALEEIAEILVEIFEKCDDEAVREAGADALAAWRARTGADFHEETAPF